VAFQVGPDSAIATQYVQPTTVVIQDSLGRTVTGATDSITLNLAPGTGTPGAALVGTVTLPAFGGVALFAHIVIDSAGTGYRLIATAPGLASDTTGAFSVRGCDCWTTEPALPGGRVSLGAAAIGETVYAVGGLVYPNTTLSDLLAYDTHSNAWSARAPLPTPGAGHTVVAIDNTLYVIGGGTGGLPPGGTGPTNAFRSYSPASNTWTTLPPLPTIRGSANAVVVHGIIYVLGGNRVDTIAAMGTVEAYDPATGIWTTKAPMPTPRFSFGAGAVGNVIYTFGGMTYNQVAMHTVEAYDVTTNTWSSKAPLLTARAALGSGVLRGGVYALGGGDSTAVGVLPTVEAYDPATNAWHYVATMPSPRLFFGVAVVKDLLYAMGGSAAALNNNAGHMM
jgi:N-acetylneuraminic acid mutarotase